MSLDRWVGLTQTSGNVGRSIDAYSRRSGFRTLSDHVNHFPRRLSTILGTLAGRGHVSPGRRMGWSAVEVSEEGRLRTGRRREMAAKVAKRLLARQGKWFTDRRLPHVGPLTLSSAVGLCRTIVEPSRKESAIFLKSCPGRRGNSSMKGDIAFGAWLKSFSVDQHHRRIDPDRDFAKPRLTTPSIRRR